MQEHAGRPLLLADRVVFTCQSSGACCRNDWLIGVDRASWERLRGVDWSAHDPALGRAELFVPLREPLAGGESMTFARTREGACVFLDGAARCRIHTRLGHRAKPQVCREFPYAFVETPDGVAVGLSFACTAVRGHHGQPLAAQAPEIRDVLAGSVRVNRLPDPIVLYSGLDIAWDDYRPIEAGLLALLGAAGPPFPRALVAGSLLVSLAVSLRQVEARARAAGQAPPETLASGLATLAAEGHRRLLDLAAAVRPPRRPSLAYLAPLHAWLQLSRARISRLALVWTLYRDLLKFRKVRGRVPDLVTGGPPVDLAAVQRVRFDAEAPGVDDFLREYWTHVVFRKTLVPMHGVFRGYHTLLALYGFARWAARVRALRAGRPATGLADVQEAVRLVEQRFVLHSQFANLFALSAVLTVLADRLFAQPAFVPSTALDAPWP
jgi:Fe-S-cluster containining protein